MSSFVENVNKLANSLPADIGSTITSIESDILALQTGKVDKVAGKELSSNDYTDEEKNKLSLLSTTTVISHVHDSSEIITGNFDASRINENASRVFVTPTQKALIDTAEQVSMKGQANGYAPLGADGKINASFLSSLNVLDVYPVADEASMLALSQANQGDIAFREDNQNSYMLIGLPASTLANWKQLNTSGVTSVNGQTGIVSISTTDISEGSNKYFTDERVDDRVAALIQAGTNVSVVYNDAANTLTISANDTSVAFSEITGTPTTLSGYGIADAYTKTEITTLASNYVLSSYLSANYYTQSQINTLASNYVLQTGLKTVSGQSLLGSGDITVASDASLGTILEGLLI